jgi:hypothetical protein
VYTGNQLLVLKTHITFVHIDEEGNAIPIGDKARKRINNLLSPILPQERLELTK